MQMARPATQKLVEGQGSGYLLHATGINKSYRRRRVLQGVELRVGSGEVAAIIGANGAGKSTFLKICAGLMSPDSGEVRLNGKVSYCPQQAGVFEFLLPDEHFVLFGAAQGLSRRRAREEGRGLASKLSWPVTPTQARWLSGGTQQKLNLSLAALGDPDILLLDEPYQGFDQGTYVNFWDQVFEWRDAGKAVVLVTHMLNSLDRVDHVLDLTAADGPEGRRA